MKASTPIDMSGGNERPLRTLGASLGRHNRAQLNPLSPLGVPHELAHSSSLPQLYMNTHQSTAIARKLPALFRRNKGRKGVVRQQGWTELHSVAAKGDLRGVTALTKKLSTNPRCKTTSGVTPLDVAKYYHHKEVHQFLSSIYFKSQRPVIVKVSTRSVVLSWEPLQAYSDTRGIKYEVLVQTACVGEYVPVRLCEQCDVCITKLAPGKLHEPLLHWVFSFTILLSNRC